MAKKKSHQSAHLCRIDDGSDKVAVQNEIYVSTRAKESTPLLSSGKYATPLACPTLVSQHKIDYIDQKRSDVDSSGKTGLDVSVSVVFDPESNSAGLLKHEILYPALPHFTTFPFDIHI